jgi:hypothetical protein
VTANTWHYLLSRRLEVQAFSEHPAVDVLARDIARAAALAGAPETNHLRRLVAALRACCSRPRPRLIPRRCSRAPPLMDEIEVPARVGVGEFLEDPMSSGQPPRVPQRLMKSHSCLKMRTAQVP